MNERDVFMAALQIEDAARRSTYLERACAGEAALRQRVDALLVAFGQAGDFLQQPAENPSPTSDFSNLDSSRRADSIEQPGTIIGPYKLIEPIGEGGMGSVWMAQQTEPVKRLVALKLIKAGMDSKQVIARFEAERQALALMDHPNIAKVLDGGTTSNGRPYFVMDLVKGVPITKYCDEHHVEPRKRLELFIPICHAIQHAHQKGIIHRDLKPSNVLVALCDGRPVPKVIDFGVAKAAGQSLTDKTLVTGFGAIVGTPEYMSPEQAEVNQLDIDTRSDIYSLGVLLYELLTGGPPFSKKELEKVGMLEMLRVIREEEPSKPSTKLSTALGLPTLAANRGTEPAKLTKLIRGELDWIVMKALEKDRSRRYETANGFAMDVQRYLADEAVQACPPSVGYRMRKFVRRNKRALAATALVGVLLLVSAVVATVFAFQADRSAKEAFIAGEEKKKEAARATQEAENATLARQEAERVLGMQLVSNGVAAMDKGDFSGAAIWFAEAGRRDRSNAERNEQHLMRLASAIRMSPRPTHILQHEANIRFAALSPDGKRLATIGKDAQIWDVRSGVKVGPKMPHGEAGTYAKFSNDGRLLMTITTRQFLDNRYEADQIVRVWEAASGRLLTPPLVHKGWSLPSFVLDDTCVVTRSGVNTVQLWHAESGKPNGEPLDVPGKPEDMHSFLVSPDGRSIAVVVRPRVAKFGPRDRKISKALFWIWNVQTRQTISIPLDESEDFHSLFPQFSPDGARLVFNNPWEVANAIDVRTGKKLSSYARPGGGMLYHVFAKDNRHVFSSNNKNSELWDTETGRAVGAPVDYHYEFDLRGGRVGYQPMLSPDGLRLLGPAPDQPTVRVVWDTHTGKRLGQAMQHETPIASEIMSPDGSIIATSSEDGIVRTWEFTRAHEGNPYGRQEFRNVSPPFVHDREVTQMLFGVDGRQLITVAGSIVRIWPLESDPEPDARFDHPFPIWRLVASADGQRAVTVCAARSVDTQAEVRIWDLANGRLIGEPFKPAVGGIGLTVSPDNRHAILSVSRAQNNVEFFLGDLQSGEWRPLPRPNIYMSPYFSPGGRYLLRVQPMSKSADVSYQLIETASGRDVSDLLQGRQPAMGAVRLDSKSCWAPDDRRIVVRADAGVQVWDLDKREAVTPVLRHEGGIAAGGTFSQDGLRIISDSNERTDVRLWDALTGAPLGPQVQLIPDRAQVDEVYWQRSPDGRRLLVWGSYATTPLPVRLWDLTAGKYLELPGVVDLGDFHGQGFSPDGQRVLAKTANGLRVFDAVAGTPLTPEMTPGPPYQIRDHFGYGRAISGRFSPDGRFVLTEVPTQIWDAASGLPLTAPFPAGVKVSDNVPVLNLDGSTIVVPSSPTTLSIFRLHVREKNLDELAALAETIGARRLTASGTMQALEPDQVAAGWHAFRNTALPARGGEATEWHRRRIARLGYDQRTELLRGRGLGAITTLHEFTRATRPLNLLEQSNAFAARWHFDRLLALERNPNAVANRAFAHFVLRDWDKAVADFDEAIAAGVPDLWGARGEAQAERGKFREAQADFEKAVPKQREPLGLLVKLAHVQAELRDDARLQVTCAKIRPHLSNHKPEYSHSHVLLRALALGDSRDPEFAEFVKSFENFWLPLKNRRDWDRGTALFGIGMARYRLGDYDAAFAALSEAEPFLVGDQRPFGLLPLAATCLKTNRAKEAREWLDKVEPSAYESTSLLWHERLELKRWRREVDELIKPDG